MEERMRHFIHGRICRQSLFLYLCFMMGWVTVALRNQAAAASQPSELGKVQITNLKPAKEKGQGYKMVYLVQAPLDIYWRFKTDFDNEFVVTNKYIRQHRVISQTEKVVVTENKYHHFSDYFFRWQTLIHSDQYRLEFKLLNPEECRQKFHFGYIQMEAVPGGTQVTQVAYFDFFGAGLWARFPWKGGMKDFLTHTARWEQDTILRLKDRYIERIQPY